MWFVVGVVIDFGAVWIMGLRVLIKTNTFCKPVATLVTSTFFFPLVYIIVVWLPIIEAKVALSLLVAVVEVGETFLFQVILLNGDCEGNKHER